MNVLEREMILLLKDLKENCSCIQIKAEFEAEGTRMVELTRLKDITSVVGLPIIMKIGGVESVTDVYNCLEIGVAGIIAPMVETPYALYKYGKMIETMIAPDNAEDIDFYFNMETRTGYENFPAMMELPILRHIDGVTVGRVDLTGSMGLTRSAVETREIYEICADTFRQARARNLACGLGGAISHNSIEFIRELNREKLLDKFETRKVVFRADAVECKEDILTKAIRFELLWLKSKQRYYSRIKQEDEVRIQMLEKRLNGR